MAHTRDGMLFRSVSVSFRYALVRALDVIMEISGFTNQATSLGLIFVILKSLVMLKVALMISVK